LVLRAVLNDVSPIVARVLSISDDVEITDLHDIFLRIRGWQENLGFITGVYGQECNSYKRPSHGKRFLYLCNTPNLWEWEIRVADVQDGGPDDRAPACLGGTS
jgi:hypothetical protein